MTSNEPISKSRKWTSYILQGIVVLMFLMGAINNLLQTEQAVAGATTLGYAAENVLPLGIVLLVSTVLFAIPRTSLIGAILLTGWLGGAVASHVIHGDPLFNTLFPILFGILIWVSLLLRNNRIQL